jgi:Putative Flp pilus-assembly TadE/G-like
MKPGRGARRRDERGAVAILVAVVATTLFIIAALVVDLGLARDTKQQSQNAADASALAAGNVLYSTTSTAPNFTAAVAAAKSYASSNFDVASTAWAGCTDPGKLGYTVPGETECISFDQSAKPTLVRVVIPEREVSFGLGVLAGVTKVDITTGARAALAPPGLPCILCVLGSGLTHDLQNGDVLAQNGNVHFNGSVSVGTNGLVVTNGQTTVEGTASGSLANYTPDPTTGVSPIPDPLAFLALPPDMSTLAVKTNPCTDGPGKYGSFSFPNSTCTLTAGLYVIAGGYGGSGAQWAQSGNNSSVIAGSGVTLYFTCGTPNTPIACPVGEQGAWIDFTGNGSITITPPLSGPLKGVSIVYDRNNTQDLRLTGNGIAGMQGTIYTASGTLQMNGNGCTATNAAVVVRDIEMNGNPSCISVVADPSSTPDPPPAGLHLDQ